MKKLNQILCVSAMLALFSFAADAHDPKLHAKKAEKANCAPLEKMKKENKNLDMTDPVMIAMMKKCEKQALSKDMKHKIDHSENTKQNKKDHSKMEHKKMKEKNKDDDHKH